ncbi:DNA sulfur modification protein DndB, partial [Mycobacterium tuberculosis]|uniref:DNA sulfur modification protein DndB n=1 Tax=Mycobacterium tuberculosis TaxID=1773 RepID=UPI0027BA2FA4
MCPLRLIPKIFLFDEEEIPAEHRAQRLMNKSRIPEITNYILENSKDYIFSSLTASVDGEMRFEA